MRARQAVAGARSYREEEGDRRDTPAQSGAVMAELDHATLKALADAHLTDLRMA